MMDLHNSSAISEGIDVVFFKGFNVDGHIFVMSLQQLLCSSSHILRYLWKINELFIRKSVNTNTDLFRQFRV